MNTWTAKGISTSWRSVSISSTGQYGLACVFGGQIYVSKDFGNSWTAKTTGNLNWSSVSISSTGQYGLACAQNEKIYVSKDFGNSWTAKDSNRPWYSVSISSTGKYGLACVNGEKIYASTDGGDSWSEKMTDLNIYWHSVSISSNGEYGLACVFYGQIYVSKNSGASWTATNSDNTSWISVSISSTGQYGLACVYGGQIYVSSDSGDKWTATNSGSAQWISVSISSTGQYGLACVYGGQIYASSDYGINWTAKTSGNVQWYSVSISSNGQYGLAGVNGGHLYISQAKGLVSPPTNLTAPSSTLTTIDIAFSAPSSTVDSYRVTATDISNSSIFVTQSIIASLTTHTITGLTSGTTYTIQLASIIGSKSSATISTSGSTLVVPRPPTNLTAPSSTATTIDIAFSAPSIAVDSYRVTATDISNSSIFVTQTITKSLTTYTITDLSQNTRYNIELVSVNGIYSSAPVSTTGTTLFEYIVSFSNSTRFNPANLAAVPGGLTSLSIDNTLTRITISSNNQGQLIYYNPNITTRNTFLGPSGMTAILNMAITPDGNRGIAAGWNNKPYYFTWNGTSYTTLTQTLHPNIKPLGNCTGLDITADGNRIVYTDNTTKCIYFAKWNNTNYDEFTKTLDISRNTYYGLGISKNGSKIAYGVFPGNTVYVANWNDTNYGVGTAISYLGNAQPIQIRFSPGGNVIYMSTSTNSVGSVQYSILYNGIYSTFKYVPTTAISANAHTAGFYVSSAGVLYVMRSSQNFVTSTTPTYTPEPDTPPPINLTAPSSTSTTINLTFSAPSTAVESYRVTAIDNSNTSIFVTQTIDNSLNAYTITGLTPSTTYTIQLVSIIGNESSATISVNKATSLDDSTIGGMTNKTSVVAAYGFKRYSYSYTQPTVNVRNGTSGVTADFYASFTGALGTSINATGTSLLSWLNGATGFITTWYDQSGRGKHLTQATTSLQPSISIASSRYYAYFNNKTLSTGNIFDTTSINEAHIVFRSQQVAAPPTGSFLISFNGNEVGLADRTLIHAPYTFNMNMNYLMDLGNYNQNNRAQSTATANGSIYVFSGYKPALTTDKNGFRLNSGTRYTSTANTSANVGGGLVIGLGATSNNHFYGLIVCNKQLGTADETRLETNI